MLWDTCGDCLKRVWDSEVVGRKSGEKEGWCLGRGLCERLGKLRWIVVKLAGVTQVV